MFGEQFHLQNPQSFFIGQNPSVLTLFVVPGAKVPPLYFRCDLLHIA